MFAEVMKELWIESAAHAIRRLVACAAFFMLMANAACSSSGGHEVAVSDGAVAQPGLPRFRQVDAELYRGGQPSSKGLRSLDAMGIKTVVCLRTTNVNASRAYGTKLTFVRLPMSPWRPREEDVIAFLRIATDPAQAPVFVHCEHGCDRTGMLCAMYRVVVQGWSKDDAIAEMTRDGMGFHDVYQNLIRFVRDADVERIQHEVEASRDRVAVDSST